ncbi:AAA family ATPase [Nonomuraea sp. NPDC050663]|uniref:AAA family ATPase n=1 Tax=Nonomuraea sp. NPDC050663 TaxID=3364370 RepID=UPI0037A9C4E4
MVLFIDIVGSTELAERLDPELLLRILERYYDACRGAILDRGGVVEKYIGDAIMAVFGVPAAREDDALRAALAAAEAMDSVHRLSEEIGASIGVRLDAHCGIAYGAVMVVSEPGSDVRVVGDTVNTAARLQSAAGDGEILLGEGAARLVRRHAVTDEVPPLRLKGKRDPVRAWRLVAVEPDRDQPESDAIPLIGRETDLDRLTLLHEQVARERRCRVATVLGAPGIGKSRLVREFLRGLPAQVTVLTGRCSSYGIGATYRPITEMIEPLDVDDPALRALAGRQETPGTAEIARAVRALFERLAPVVVVLDNLQWAEPTLLDLVEECARDLTGAPVLLLCVARPELPARCDGSTTLELGPLPPAAMERLVAELCAARADVTAHDLDTLHGGVAARADGNPLFAELMLETAGEGGADLPPTIQALLGARLDLLGRAEREVLERAATIGQTFTAGQVRALLGDDPAPAVGDLLRERLIRRVPGGFEFTQTLTREIVYSLTRKESRADWHRALAGGLTQEAGMHLLAACRLTREVRPGDPLLPELTDRAAASLIRDGGQALHRKDLPAALALLEQGRETLPPGRDEHRSLAVRISDARMLRGEAPRALSALDRAEELLPGDPRNALTCAIQREILTLRSSARAPLLVELRERLDHDPGDDLSWCRFHQLEALVRIEAGGLGAAERALRDGLERARAMGDRYEEDRLLIGLCELVQWSPTPVAEGLEIARELMERFAGDRALLVPVLVTRARLLALRGSLDAAEEALRVADGHAQELRLGLAAITVTQVRGLVEALGGRHEQAELRFTEAARALRAAGHAAPAATLELYAAREAFHQGEARRAAAALEQAPEGPRQLRAELVALTLEAAITAAGTPRTGEDAIVGRTEEARRLLDRAVDLLASTDDPCLRGDVLFEAARIDRAAGRDPSPAAHAARAAYLSKGAALPVRAVDEWMGEP